jgi:EAL domain-containing protein (putative c-di-GMP-specific phosphodiesterase class I)
VAVPSHEAAISTTASIGIAVANGIDLTADELIRDADLAVDRAKSHGPGSIEICNEDLRNEVTRSASQIAAIRHAIDADELVMHYQPIVRAGSHEPAGLEALVRWQRPGCERPVPPIEFIEFAERSSLIVDIDRWVIDAVAKQIAAWSRDGMVRSIPVAINISGRHLADDAFVDHVLVPLAAHGVDPSSITIEITESALLDDLATAAVKLQLLREAGVKVAIDDFGTGYTSIAHLRMLPVDILKIDRSITASASASPQEASIVQLIIDSGHLLGATVTAEGVETDAELAVLEALGADHIQGYYFSRPVPPDQVAFATAALHTGSS